jgi:Dna[CI] antecedent, DciA
MENSTALNVTSQDIKEKNLYVKVDSSVVRQELNFMKKRLTDRINKLLEKDLIDQITIL